jgi:hypothetical protein
MKVDRPYVRQQLFMLVEDAMNPSDGVRRCSYGRVGVQQMSEIERKPLLFVFNTVEQGFRQGSVAKIQPGPPQVFHEEFEFIRVAARGLFSRSTVRVDERVYEFHAETKEEYFLNLKRQNSYFGLSTDNSNKMPTRES